MPVVAIAAVPGKHAAPEVNIAALIGNDSWLRLHPAIRRRFRLGHANDATHYPGRDDIPALPGRAIVRSSIALIGRAPANAQHRELSG